MRKSAWPVLLVAGSLLQACSAPQPSTGQVPSAPVPVAAVPAPNTQAPTYYLSPDSISVDAAVAAPPAAGSPEALEDLAPILELQEERTSQDCARAKTEADEGLESFFGPAYGPLSGAEVARFELVFDRIQADTKFFTRALKNHWKRPRPWLEDPRISPCVPLETSKAYPSGHATVSRIFADVLDLIDPSRKPLFDARADQVAFDRVLGGVHHPLDVEAGKKLGDELFRALLRSERFKQDLRALQDAP